MDEFTIKDSGKRAEFASGMVRDTAEGKLDWTNLLHGPMLKRWAIHLTNAKTKYPDPAPGVPNWTLGDGPEELQRFKESAFRHFMQWIMGERDEDHAAGVFFNINGAENLMDRDNSDSGGQEQEVVVDSYADYLAIPSPNAAKSRAAERALADYAARRESESC